jgi:hypothetical protein
VAVGSTIPGLDPKNHAGQADSPPSYDGDSHASGDSGVDCGDLPPPYKP